MTLEKSWEKLNDMQIICAGLFSGFIAGGIMLILLGTYVVSIGWLLLAIGIKGLQLIKRIGS